MANRSKRFLAGLLSGYGLIGINIIYTLLSVPMALHYLGKVEFGLWALAQQVSGYLMLLDLGVSSALSRFLADHKDNVNGGEYGSLLITGGLVFLVQGVLIACGGIILSFFAPTLFAIPDHLATSFSTLLILLSLLSGVGIALRSISSPLWAFQRLDLVNGISSLSLILGLGVLWLGFHSGWGIYSLAFVNVPGLIVGTIVLVLFGIKHGHYPSVSHWGRPSWSRFKEIFSFGKDVVLMSLGSQLVNATQITLVSRLLGLDAAATFSVAIKFATLGQNLVQKLLESSAPGLTEMYIRGDSSGFVRRYWHIVALTAASSAIVATMVAAVNRDVISIWTRGTIQWSASGDWLLATLLCLIALSRCFIGLFGITKNLRPVRFIYLAEGILFIGIAFQLGKIYGLNGILFSSILSNLVVTTSLGLWSARAVLGKLLPAIGLYLKPFLILSVLGTMGSGIIKSHEMLPELIGFSALLGPITVMLSFFLILPRELWSQITTRFLNRMPRR